MFAGIVDDLRGRIEAHRLAGVFVTLFEKVGHRVANLYHGCATIDVELWARQLEIRRYSPKMSHLLVSRRGKADPLNMENAMHLEIHREGVTRLTSLRNAGGDWRWSLIDDAGRVVVSGEGYASKASCRGVVEALKATDAATVVKTLS